MNNIKFIICMAVLIGVNGFYSSDLLAKNFRDNDSLLNKGKSALVGDYQRRIRNQEMALQNKIDKKLIKALDNLENDPKAAEAALENLANKAVQADGIKGDVDIELYNSDTMTPEQLAEVEVLGEKYGKDEFGGFYDPKSGKIYLNASKLDGTRSQVSGILANELTHYVDHKKGRTFDQKRQEISSWQQQNLKDQLKSYGALDTLSEKDKNRFAEALSQQNFDQGNKNAAQVSKPEPAYFGKRPLGKTPGMALSKIDDKLNTEIAHEQLFFEDKEGGNLGFLPKKNKNSPSEDTPSLLNKYIKTDSGYDDAIMRQAVQNVPIKKYHLIGNNCQDWADDVRKEYKKLLKKTENKKP